MMFQEASMDTVMKSRHSICFAGRLQMYRNYQLCLRILADRSCTDDMDTLKELLKSNCCYSSACCTSETFIWVMVKKANDVRMTSKYTTEALLLSIVSWIVSWDSKSTKLWLKKKENLWLCAFQVKQLAQNSSQGHFPLTYLYLCN